MAGDDMQNLIYKDGRVWSGPLWRHLGEKRYQEFIRYYATEADSRKKTKGTGLFQDHSKQGFHPEIVRQFLERGTGNRK